MTWRIWFSIAAYLLVGYAIACAYYRDEHNGRGALFLLLTWLPTLVAAIALYPIRHIWRDRPDANRHRGRGSAWHRHRR